MRKIKRQIYFYDIELQTYDKETNSYVLSKDFKKDIQELFCSFDKMQLMIIILKVNLLMQMILV